MKMPFIPVRILAQDFDFALRLIDCIKSQFNDDDDDYYRNEGDQGKKTTQLVVNTLISEKKQKKNTKEKKKIRWVCLGLVE